ncbi:MAG: HD domain-containing protein [Firmicutes bacterium]|nr:HD domain-containing protein [Bacillota bacterium]
MLCKGDERLSVSEWKTLANKDLYDHKVSKKNSGLGLADNYLELISSFVGAVDAKDSYTADHSQRVGDLTARICNMLGLSTGSAEIITMAARLHDIGKIGIPDAVLLKSGRLTEAEWEIMQKHTVLGEDIIKCIKPFYEVSQIVRHHHERVDGMGYPDGLAGDEIPLGARIVAIADSIDAMTSKRVYRDAMSTDTCREQIEKNLGKAYDKAIGEIVLNNWHQIEHIIEFRSTNRAGWIPPIHLHIAGSK